MRVRALSFFFFNDTATTEIYTLSLHDALPISSRRGSGRGSRRAVESPRCEGRWGGRNLRRRRSEEHTSELQSRLHLVCRLLLEKKKKTSTRAGQDSKEGRNPGFPIRRLDQKGA